MRECLVLEAEAGAAPCPVPKMRLRMRHEPWDAARPARSPAGCSLRCGPVDLRRNYECVGPILIEFLLANSGPGD